MFTLGVKHLKFHQHPIKSFKYFRNAISGYVRRGFAQHENKWDIFLRYR
jgi:hypothetical protein